MAVVKTLLICLVAALAATSAHSDPPLREINVTTDSAPGWLPSVALSAQAEKTARDYLAVKDANRADDAYAMFSDIQKQHVPLSDFKAGVEAFNAKAGAVIERRIVKVTWTKDPAQAPAPGIYVAIDLASRFANVDRHCGYVVLYQSPDGGAFGVMREESSFMDNATAQGVAKDKGQDAMERAWAQLSAAYCPNYPGKP